MGTYHDRREVKTALEETLIRFINDKSGLDNITFGGNGEPTLHPLFSEIVDDAIILRDKYFPKVKISVLSNATNLQNISVIKALKKVDSPILKLDAGTEPIFQIINKPLIDITQNEIVNNIINARIENVIIQSMFLKGEYKGIAFDNTIEPNLSRWLGQLQQIKPKSVMIYSIARETPAHGLLKLTKQELETIAQGVRDLGIKAEAF